MDPELTGAWVGKGLDDGSDDRLEYVGEDELPDDCG
jgi:hypothetical protein